MFGFGLAVMQFAIFVSEGVMAELNLLIGGTFFEMLGLPILLAPDHSPSLTIVNFSNLDP